MQTDHLVFLQEVLWVQQTIVSTNEHTLRRIENPIKLPFQVICLQRINIQIISIKRYLHIVRYTMQFSYELLYVSVEVETISFSHIESDALRFKGISPTHLSPTGIAGFHGAVSLVVEPSSPSRKFGCAVFSISYVITIYRHVSTL